MRTFLNTGIKTKVIDEIISFAEKYNIPKSTLYDILTKYVTDNDLSMIKSLFEFNKRHK